MMARLVTYPADEDQTSPNSKYTLFQMMNAYGFDTYGTIPRGMKAQWESGWLDAKIAERLQPGWESPQQREDL